MKYYKVSAELVIEARNADVVINKLKRVGKEKCVIKSVEEVRRVKIRPFTRKIRPGRVEHVISQVIFKKVK